MEDRLESNRSYEGYKIGARENGIVTFSEKKRKIADLSRETEALMHRYFSDDF